MLSRSSAVLLVMLIVLPFTAPFATCDAPASRSGSTVRSLIDQTATHALPVARTATRTRIKLAISIAGTVVRLRLPLVPGRISRATAATRLVAAPLTTPLRI